MRSWTEVRTELNLPESEIEVERTRQMGMGEIGPTGRVRHRLRRRQSEEALLRWENEGGDVGRY